MQDLLAKLNPSQQTIVQDTEGYILTLAGAGSGKTRVLTYRIAYLMANFIKPWRIMSVTFTNKAAKEMRHRLGLIVGDESSSVWIGTFHSICVRLLRAYGKEIGLVNFTILDEKERAKMLKQAAQLLGYDYEVEAMVAVISNAKNDLLSPAELLQMSERKHEKEIAHIYQAYEDKNQELGYMDFDDLIMKTVQLLRNVPEVRERVQDQFQYVHADEGQDTNAAQYTLLDLITAKHGNMFIVADVDQSIYKWRGAKVQNMIKFKEMYPNSKLYKLEQNYRSSANIVNAANAVISRNKIRLEKTAYTENPPGEPIILYQAEDDGREADFVASVISRLIRVEGRSYKDFAILYRTGRQSRAIEVALTQAGHRYQVLGGTSFYDRKEIKDITAYLRLISNDLDALAMERVINVPKRGIGDTTVKKIEDYANVCQIPFPKAVENIADIGSISKGTKAKIENFVEFVQALREFAYQPNTPVATIILEILNRTGYRDQFDTAKDEDAARLDNIQELINVADQWDKENTEEKTLSDFLAETTLSGVQDEMEDDDHVTLMTGHAAKGLEFPIVFIIGLEENILPHGKSLADPEDIEEERRIMYVAITRAEVRLFLTYCKCRYEYGDHRPKMNKPSRFLGEIPQELVKRIG